jgi:hypothetical protein
MSPVARYAGMAGGVVLAAVLVAFTALDGTQRAGVLLAAGVVAGVQAVGFGLLLRFRHEPRGFLGAWLGGTLLRLGALGVVAAAVWVRDDLDPLWTLLGVAGLFFVLHLLEPLALRGAGPQPGTGNKTG